MPTRTPPLTPFFSAGSRRPALVPLTGSAAPRGARLVRLRVRDRPGSLAAVTGHLAEHHVNVLRLEVLARDSGFAIDDVLLTGDELDTALESGECLAADGRAPWAATAFRHQLPSGAVLAVPGGSPSFLVLVLVREDNARFISTEVDRLAALVRVAVGTLQLHVGLGKLSA